jgi:hypothetical protein
VLGLAPGLDPTTDAAQSSFYASGPRLVILLGVPFLLISAWALRHVNPQRRED